MRRTSALFLIPHQKQQPGHTPGHVACPACDQLRQGTVDPRAFAQLTFREAAPAWLSSHQSDIAAKTHYDYRYYIRCLDRFFGDLPLADIHIGHITAYQEDRRKAAGASCINHEINTLKQILGHAGLWTEVGKYYKPLRVPKSKVGRAMEPEDEERLFQVASSSTRWKIAYWCSILTATTTAGPKEISHLHVNDIDLEERPGAVFGTLRIRDGIKNGHRERIMPLNEASRWAIEQILARYAKLCRRLKFLPHDEHYILPGRGRSSPFDPWKPMGSWKKAWRSLRIKAGMPELRMYDLRHHAITKLMEDPEISERTVEEMAGHALSSSMKKRYSHIRMKPKVQATQALELKLPPKKPPKSASLEEAPDWANEGQ